MAVPYKTSHPRGPNLVTQVGAGKRMVSADGLRWAISANRKRSLPGHRFDAVEVWILKERVHGKVVIIHNGTDEERAKEFVGPDYTGNLTERRAAPTAPATKETNMETINMTPRGCETPEGVERVNKAMEAQTNAIVNVANTATEFIRQYGYEIEQAIKSLNHEGAIEDWNDLREAIKDRTAAQDEFLRAVAGAPAAPETYPVKRTDGRVVNVTVPPKE